MPPTQPAPLARFFEAPSSNVIPLPLVLLLGCSASVEARCRAVGARGRILVRASPFPFRRSDVTALAPLVIVVPLQIYEGAPWAFEVLAEKAAAGLVVLGHETSELALEHLLLESLVFASRKRDRAHPSEVWAEE